ncbi:formylglycine-generating enzyme family protein [Ruania alba]|uniref:Formylglycine-generating enzyme, required for sulfatase activity, contains SUMF1/FGE domain n=1 Tax=Ruania alba TaxID=648782 RepID=A0A1H5D283_9MICO|nr:formylglycine-generating enzyme family protein [Ruania alba]SED72962.1 Formylglycine-generating enzyme, required for sulfatase activity, contains SUMF1/FGE domain [Ruania alba]
MTEDNVDQPKTCCAPARETPQGALAEESVGEVPAGAGRGQHAVEQCAVPAQTFQMGDADGVGYHADGETPVHPVTVDAFSIDATSVTNADFAAFVEATGYRTESETFGFSAVFHLALAAPEEAIMGRAPGTPWWLGVKGADWAHPGGPNSSVEGLADHPVVHISWNDAEAYCRWAGRTLPTEAQWEAASRGGTQGHRYPWGAEFPGDGDQWRANIWQGRFPVDNTVEDGFLTTAPVRTFSPNAYGLWQTVGNVWEWCADWFDPRYYTHSPAQNPTGPEQGMARVLRGGSFLCHDSYCNRYRNAARSSNTPDSAMSNTGFRTVSAA